MHSPIEISSDHPSFPGHFPNFPVLPGAVLLDEVLQIMQREAPNLFSDYQLIPLDDGTFEATTPHRKV